MVIKDDGKTTVYGVGMNDANYPVQNKITVGYVNGRQKQKLVWICPFYQRWKSMLRRCYSPSLHEKYPTYKDCTVCDEWLLFSNFKAWMEKQNWEGRVLDKDILFPNNKTYSQDTCVFVDSKVNLFVAEVKTSIGNYMVGVAWCKRDRKFLARGTDGGTKARHLGCFNTELEAHRAWLLAKLEKAYKLAAEQDDPRVAKALIDRYQNYGGSCI